MNGHTAIFKKDRTVDLLPIQAFSTFHLRAIILLETTSAILLKHLNEREAITYFTEEITALANAEEMQCQLIAKKLGIPLFSHVMRYDNIDQPSIAEKLERDNL